MSQALVFSAVSFTYPDSSSPALDDVNLSIPEGAFALATGPTGSGKSTLLRAVNGLVPQFSGGTFSGRVLAAGSDTMEHAPRELADTVAFVPQDPASSFVLDRVEDELAYGMENLGVEPARMRRRVEEMLDLLAIADLRDRSVRTLSGGQQQRVAIAAALASGPRIIVLDEPTSQLDPQGAEDVLAALQRLVHDHGMTVLIAEHRLERVAGFVDMALGFPGDGSVMTGTPAEVFSALGSGPPVTRLGQLVGWTPAPLTVREARSRAGELALPTTAPPPPEPTLSASGEPLLVCEGLSAGYEVTGTAVRGISLSLRAGEVVALMGRNGSGKTTLLRALGGMHEPATGRVLTSAATAPQPGVDVALCPQDPDSVLFRDTVRDEVATTLGARGSDRSPDEILALVGIQDLADRHPRDLSAGQRLLVATAAIVATDAPVLLLDEPTRGLDPPSKERLAGFLRTWAGSGRAAIFATHDVELVARMAARVVVIANGAVILDEDTPHALADSPIFSPQMTRAFGPGWLTPEQVAEAARR